MLRADVVVPKAIRRWVLAGALSVGMMVSAAAPAAGADDGLLSMLVMGDSYSAGNGAGDYFGAKGCWRSAKNYAREFERLVEAPPYNQRAFVENVACSGDWTYEFSSSKSGRAPQINAVNSGYDLILLTIGGNDLKFAKIVQYCLIAKSRDGANCGPLLTQAENALNDGALEDRIKDILQFIGSRADPRAKIALLGYPHLEGDSSYRLRSGHGGNAFIEVGRRLRAIQDLGDQIQERVVSQLNSMNGTDRFVFVKTKDAFAGPPTHELFAKRNNSQRWFIQPFVDAGLAKRATWYHPNPAGWRAEARLLLRDRRIPKHDASGNGTGPAPGCVPVSSIAAVVDDSGSMSDNDPAAIRRSALELLISKPTSQGRTLGAVEFGGDAAGLFPPGLVSGNQQGMLAALGALADDGIGDEDDGGTDYNAAFEASSAAQPSAAARIFLTDGEHNDGEYLNGHAGGPRTFVIGLNIGPAGQGEEEADLLGRIASDTGGQYFPLRLDPNDDESVQVARLQPVMNTIDTLLGCEPVSSQLTRAFTTPGEVTRPMRAGFAGQPGLEVVVSWGALGVDVDLVRCQALNRRGDVVADLNGKRRRHPRRRKLRVNTVEGQTFDTITIRRPRRGVRLRMWFKATTLPAPIPVSFQIRPVTSTPAPGTTEVAPPPSPPPSQQPAPPAPESPPVQLPLPGDPAPPRKVITVYNKVTNGPTQMREDSVPARLTTMPWKLCGSRGCNINGTERWTGGTYDAAVCQTTGDPTTNGNNSDPGDDGNPNLYRSDRYYGVRLADGTFGYVSWVWIDAAHRGGLGLPAC